MPRLALLLALSGLALVAFSTSANAPPKAQAAAEEATYRITLTNISTGQPLSAPILATHATNVSLINPGSMAFDGLRKLAEEGSNVDLAQEWRGVEGVHDVVAGELPLRRVGGDGPPGSTPSAEFMIHAGAGDVLTIASMLICSNDAFTGAISFPLPEGDGAIVVRPFVFDAGTEANTEKSIDLPDACGVMGAQSLDEDGNGHEATSEPIAIHGGLALNGDLTVLSSWSGPVMQVKVERIGPAGQAVGSAPPRYLDEIEPAGTSPSTSNVPPTEAGSGTGEGY